MTSISPSGSLSKSALTWVQISSAAATLPGGLTIKIENHFPEAPVKGVILMGKYTLTHNGKTSDVNCSADGLGRQICELVRQLADGEGYQLTPEQTNKLHAVQQWQP